MKHTGRHQWRSPGSIERRTTVVGPAGAGLFQLALAAGAPWGRTSYGGAHSGVLPTRLRVVSSVAAVVYPATAHSVASPRTSASARRRILTAVTGVMAFGAQVRGQDLHMASRHLARWA